jgi:hypothetical protein
VLLDHVFAGIADMTEFDPLDPEGEYILDMELETGRRVMRNVLKLIAQDKAYIVQPPGITMVRDKPHPLPKIQIFALTFEPSWQSPIVSTFKSFRDRLFPFISFHVSGHRSACASF